MRGVTTNPRVGLCHRTVGFPGLAASGLYAAWSDQMLVSRSKPGHGSQLTHCDLAAVTALVRHGVGHRQPDDLTIIIIPKEAQLQSATFAGAVVDLLHWPEAGFVLHEFQPVSRLDPFALPASPPPAFAQVFNLNVQKLSCGHLSVVHVDVNGILNAKGVVESGYPDRQLGFSYCIPYMPRKRYETEDHSRP